MPDKTGALWAEFMNALERLRMWRMLLRSPSDGGMSKEELAMRVRMAESELKRFPLHWREERGEEQHRG